MVLTSAIDNVPSLLEFPMTIENETGRIVDITEQCGKVAHVILASGAEVDIEVPHKVKVGDWIVEGEFSPELASK